MTAYEINEKILRFAQNNLNQANVHTRQLWLGNGLKASSDKFDVLVLAGSIARLTPALLNKIAVGGQMLVVVGEPSAPTMSAVLVTRTDEQSWAQKTPV